MVHHAQHQTAPLSDCAQVVLRRLAIVTRCSHCDLSLFLHSLMKSTWRISITFLWLHNWIYYEKWEHSFGCIFQCQNITCLGHLPSIGITCELEDNHSQNVHCFPNHSAKNHGVPLRFEDARLKCSCRSVLDAICNKYSIILPLTRLPSWQHLQQP